MRESQRLLLCAKRLPALLRVEDVADLTNRTEKDIQILCEAGLIHPLGSPRPGCVKWFAAVEIEEKFKNISWLNKAVRAIYKYWEDDNKLKNSRNSDDNSSKSFAA